MVVKSPPPWPMAWRQSKTGFVEPLGSESCTASSTPSMVSLVEGLNDAKREAAGWLGRGWGGSERGRAAQEGEREMGVRIGRPWHLREAAALT